MSSSHEEWSDEDAEGFLKRLLIAILVVGIGYYIFSPNRRRDNRYERHQLQNGAPIHRTPLAAAAAVPSTGLGPPPNNGTRAPRPTQEHLDDEEGIESFLKQYRRVPPHHLPLNQITSSSGGRTSHSGLVPFRYTRAAVVESTSKLNSANNSGDDSSVKVFENRKDRARILARLFAARKIDPPPGKGKILILSLSFSRVLQSDNLSLHRVLYLLGTYYNTFVMVQCEEDEYDKHEPGDRNDNGFDGIQNNATEQDAYIQDKQRCNSIISNLYSSGILANDTIPSHRVVIVKSLLSQVAFVRSFPVQPDYVILESEDKEKEDLQLQLTKFGYNVLQIKSLDALLSD